MVKKAEQIMIDGNEAVARIAYKVSEVFAIYPITPSSSMGELCDEWAAKGQLNLWDTVPEIIEMQSEGGAAGAIHGMVQGGSLAATFTASQGLLLMIPNMYKIAGELTPNVIHVASRSLAAQALSIFGDHQDVMAVRQTGYAMLASSSIQEAHDMALIAHASTLESRIPFVHFFDGFRTSHEINKIDLIDDKTIRAMIDDGYVIEHKKRGLNPENPFIRGTSQNPDVYFQARETVNKYYDAVPDIVQKYMDKFAKLTGRKYKVFDYYGSNKADRIAVVMGSAATTLMETVDFLNKKGEKVGVLQVHLYRPFSSKYLLEAIPSTVKSITVLDRTKESGAAGEPLYQDILAALNDNK